VERQWLVFAENKSKNRRRGRKVLFSGNSNRAELRKCKLRVNFARIVSRVISLNDKIDPNRGYRKALLIITTS
jgi:hypothetical protein